MEKWNDEKKFKNDLKRYCENTIEKLNIPSQYKVDIQKDCENTGTKTRRLPEEIEIIKKAYTVSQMSERELPSPDIPSMLPLVNLKKLPNSDKVNVKLFCEILKPQNLAPADLTAKFIEFQKSLYQETNLNTNIKEVEESLQNLGKSLISIEKTQESILNKESGNENTPNINTEEIQKHIHNLKNWATEKNTNITETIDKLSNLIKTPHQIENFSQELCEVKYGKTQGISNPEYTEKCQQNISKLIKEITILENNKLFCDNKLSSIIDTKKEGFVEKCNDEFSMYFSDPEKRKIIIKAIILNYLLATPEELENLPLVSQNIFDDIFHTFNDLGTYEKINNIDIENKDDQKLIVEILNYIINEYSNKEFHYLNIAENLKLIRKSPRGKKIKNLLKILHLRGILSGKRMGKYYNYHLIQDVDNNDIKNFIQKIKEGYFDLDLYKKIPEITIREIKETYIFDANALGEIPSSVIKILEYVNQRPGQSFIKTDFKPFFKPKWEKYFEDLIEIGVLKKEEFPSGAPRAKDKKYTQYTVIDLNKNETLKTLIQTMISNRRIPKEFLKKRSIVEIEPEVIEEKIEPQSQPEINFLNKAGALRETIRRLFNLISIPNQTYGHTDLLVHTNLGTLELKNILNILIQHGLIVPIGEGYGMKYKTVDLTENDETNTFVQSILSGQVPEKPMPKFISIAERKRPEQSMDLTKSPNYYGVEKIIDLFKLFDFFMVDPTTSKTAIKGPINKIDKKPYGDIIEELKLNTDSPDEVKDMIEQMVGAKALVENEKSSHGETVYGYHSHRQNIGPLKVLLDSPEYKVIKKLWEDKFIIELARYIQSPVYLQSKARIEKYKAPILPSLEQLNSRPDLKIGLLLYGGQKTIDYLNNTLSSKDFDQPKLRKDAQFHTLAKGGTGQTGTVSHLDEWFETNGWAILHNEPIPATMQEGGQAERVEFVAEGKVGNELKSILFDMTVIDNANDCAVKCARKYYLYPNLKKLVIIYATDEPRTPEYMKNACKTAMKKSKPLGPTGRKATDQEIDTYVDKIDFVHFEPETIQNYFGTLKEELGFQTDFKLSGDFIECIEGLVENSKTAKKPGQMKEGWADLHELIYGKCWPYTPPKLMKQNIFE